MVAVLGQILIHFIQSRSDAGSCRNVARLVRNIRSIEIPVRNEVVRHVRVAQHHVECAYSLVEILLVLCIAVANCEAVDSPSLSACPYTLVSVALSCVLVQNLTCVGVVVDYVIAAAVRTEVVLQSSVSVDLPTLGRPTIPQLNPIFLNLLDKSKVPFVRDFLEICILLSWEPWQQGSLRRLPPGGTRLSCS